MNIARFFITGEPENPIVREEPLTDHLTHVSELAATFGKKVGLENFMRLAGLLHDGGKYSEAFQLYIHNAESETEADYRIGRQKSTHSDIDHGIYGARYIFDRYGHKDKTEARTAEILMLICAYHHGGLPDYVSEDGHSPVEHRLQSIEKEGLDPLANVMGAYKREMTVDLDALFQQANSEMVLLFKKIKGMSDSLFQRNLLIKLCYSMLIDADRLDSMCFETSEDGWEKYLQDNNSDDIFRKDQIHFEKYMVSIQQKVSDNKGIRKVNEIRSEISEECYDKGKVKNGLYRLTVPTGGGKTFASMRFALRHNIINSAERIIYIIPFTSIIEQNADELRKALGKGCDLLEHHSNVVEDNKAEDYKLLTTRWENSIVLSTMVQFLNTFFDAGTQNMRRLHNLANATIIFDEIQALPTRCLNLFNSTINFLADIMNTTIVLCTATQPEADNQYMKKIDLAPYPEIITEVTHKFTSLKRVCIVNDIRVKSYSVNDTVDYIFGKKAEVNSLLVVLNKVASVQKVYKELEKAAPAGVKLFHLSSNMSAQHKADVLNDIRAALAAKESVICISTSLIEAGVDISFEAAIRNNTKLDSIAQTAGRVNRNGERDMGYCHVINLDEGSYAKIIDIEIGAGISKYVMETYPDVLMPEAIKTYYNKFYDDTDISRNFNYPTDYTSIYQLLSNVGKNTSGYVAPDPENKHKYPFQFALEFQIAGKNFAVIDQNTKSVLVPYKKGRELINAAQGMNEYTKSEEKIELLKEMQPYTVNLYHYAYKNLHDKGAIYENKVLGISILSDGYYDDHIGIVDEPDADNFTL